jgi:glycine dehydrogenase
MDMTDKRLRLTELQSGANFIPRHIGPRQHEIDEMLKVVGAKSLDDLIDKVVPKAIRQEAPLDLPEPLSERNTLSDLRRMAGRNHVYTSMIGMGYYGCVTPKVILRNVLENPGWYTAYTPYQAEVSQGRLEALLIFQQMVTDFTGLPLANSSLLDEATAAAEAMAMARRVTKTKANAFFVDRDTHPQTLSVIETRARAFGFEVIVGDPDTELEADKLFGALLSYPGSSGEVRDHRGAIEKLHGAGALAIMATDLLALALLESPGKLGADVAVGSAQRFGVPMGYGGPHAAFFATRQEYRRALPGRVIGVSVDSHGKRALRMALQTREQHIRREKATSNICTAQVLLAVIAALFGVYHGPAGVARIARRAHRWAEICARVITDCGYEVVTRSFFDTITVRAPGRAQAIAARAREQRINLRVVDSDHLAISFDETTRRSEVERLLASFKTAALKGVSLDKIDEGLEETIAEGLRRTEDFLSHPVFSLYHSETEMLRFLRRMQHRDIALNRSMIPLGSCTMKLNATTEMQPISWREFNQHAPVCTARADARLSAAVRELETHAVRDAPATMRCRCSPTPAARANTPACWPSAPITEPRRHAARRLSDPGPRRTAPTRPAPRCAGLRVVIVACDDRAISISTICVPRPKNMPTGSPRS